MQYIYIFFLTYYSHSFSLFYLIVRIGTTVQWQDSINTCIICYLMNTQLQSGIFPLVLFKVDTLKGKLLTIWNHNELLNAVLLFIFSWKSFTHALVLLSGKLVSVHHYDPHLFIPFHYLLATLMITQFAADLTAALSRSHCGLERQLNINGKSKSGGG